MKILLRRSWADKKTKEIKATAINFTKDPEQRDLCEGQQCFLLFFYLKQLGEILMSSMAWVKSCYSEN